MTGIINLRLPEELKEEFKQACMKNHPELTATQVMSTVLRRLIIEYVEKNKK